MLRRELGDELFQQCVSTFYEEFKYGNALSQDFQKVVESISGKAFELILYTMAPSAWSSCFVLKLEIQA